MFTKEEAEFLRNLVYTSKVETNLGQLLTDNIKASPVVLSIESKLKAIIEGIESVVDTAA